MSYQVLARKWRPRVFREMVGQEHVLQALVNALDHDRLHHAYLFTGTRGVGKTTIARILAKCLNCEEGVSSEPCGQCSSCLEIAEGRCVDLLEVDAASRTKVEDTRELLDNVQYAPTRARYKVYLIDEVHMLSNHSFNALLKTLEEPPPHVKFLLATTDPQKLPATILSRCLQFNLKNMPPEQIVGHLSAVLSEESVQFEDAALWLLARSASGSMRDALSLTDQAIAFGSGRVVEDEVRSMLGTVDLSFVYQLLENVLAGDPEAVLATVTSMGEHAPDFEASLDELISLIHRVAIAQLVPDAIDNSWGDAARIGEIARVISAEDAQLFYQLTINGKRDIVLAPDPRGGFEMILLRMLAFRPVAVIDENLDPAALQEVAPAGDSSPVALEGDASAKKSPEPVLEGAQAPPVPARSPLEDATPAASAPEPMAMAVSMGDAGGSKQAQVAEREHCNANGTVAAVAAPPAAPEIDIASRAEPVAATVVAEQTVASAQDEPDEPDEQVISRRLEDLTSASWATTLEQLGLVGIIYNTASHCELHSREENKLQFVLDEPRAALFNPGHIDKIRAALENYFGTAVSVNIEPGTLTGESPAMVFQRRAEERQAQAVAEIEQDPVLQGLISRFDGELDRSSIAPLDQ